VEAYLEKLDRLLILSVFPGFGGQKFMPEVLEKVKQAAALRRSRAYSFRLEMDGGIGPLTLAACQAAGADTFVIGSAIFKARSYAEVVKTCQEILTKQ